MTAPRIRAQRERSRRNAALAAALMLAASGAAAHGQGVGPDPVAELIRKAEAREAENGFCATVDWPPGTRESYVRFLEIAMTGFAKINTFQNGAHCQFDRVTEIYQGPSGKCVRYTWWACASGKNCGRGADADCRQADGSWARQ